MALVIDSAKPRLKFLKMLKDAENRDVECWSDNGKYIRWYWDIGYIGCGNDLADTWMPKYLGSKRKLKAPHGIIIVEDKFDADEQDHFIMHDLFERCTMAYGIKYDPAHAVASYGEST